MASTSSPLLPPPPSPKSYPFWFGGAAASWAAVCTHPLDLAKVRMQTSHSKGMLHTLKISIRSDGLLRGAYTGLSASILRQMTYSITRFGIYDALKQRLTLLQPPGKPLEIYKIVFCASVAGGLGGIAGNPADVVLVRMTSDSVRSVGERFGYRNCFDGVFRIVRDEGVGALFRGVGPNVARAILMNASQLATYDVFKNTILSSGGMTDGLGLHFLSSFLAGTVATTICAPFDVIKSRIMHAAAQESTVHVITRAFKTEGLTWLFKGWTPAWIRLSPNTIIIFMTLEQIKKAWDTAKGRD